MRMWKRALAVAMAIGVCFNTPAQILASTKVATVQESNTDTENTNNETAKSTETAISAIKAMSVSIQSTRSKKYVGKFKVYAYSGGGITATGTRTKANRTVAVDPSVIPLGTKIMVNGKVYVAEDTGGAIKGKKLDIYMPSEAACRQWGVRTCKVYILG